MKFAHTFAAALLLSTGAAYADPVADVTIETHQLFGLPPKVEVTLPPVGGEAEVWFDRAEHEYTESCVFQEGVDPFCHNGVVVSGRRVHVSRSSDDVLEVKVSQVTFSGFNTLPTGAGSETIQVPKILTEAQHWPILLTANK